MFQIDSPSSFVCHSFFCSDPEEYSRKGAEFTASFVSSLSQYYASIATFVFESSGEAQPTQNQEEEQDVNSSGIQNEEQDSSLKFQAPILMLLLSTILGALMVL